MSAQEIPQSILFPKPLDGELLIQELTDRVPAGFELVAVVYRGAYAHGSWVSNNGYNSGSQDKLGAPIAATAYYVPMGIFQKSKDRAIADLHAARQDQDNKFRALEKTLAEAKELQKAHEEEIVGQAKRINGLNSTRDSERAEVQKAREKEQLMERHLAKLRAAIGEIEFNKIVASAPEQKA